MKVGEQMYPGRSMPDGVAVEGGRGWLVVISLTDPTPEEVSAVESGRVELAVALGGDGHVLVWCVLIDGAIDWSACVWAPWERSAIEQTHGEADRQVVQVALVDARDTTVRALRTVGLSPGVGAALAALEASCVAAGRADALLNGARQWAGMATGRDVERVVAGAQVRTWVDARHP